MINIDIVRRIEVSKDVRNSTIESNYIIIKLNGKVSELRLDPSYSSEEIVNLMDEVVEADNGEEQSIRVF